MFVDRFLSRFLPHVRDVAIVLAGAVFLWSLGLPGFLHTASASALVNVSDTLSDSAPSQSATNTVAFTSSTTVPTNGLVRVTFDPLGLGFDLTLVASSSVTVTGMTWVADRGSCTAPSSNEVYVDRIDTATDSIDLRVCNNNGSDQLLAGAKTVRIGNPAATPASPINPASAGSYIIRVETRDASNLILDNADTRVAIVNAITMTASVDTSFTFTVVAVASGTPVNGVTTSTGTLATLIGFGTLSVGTSSIAAQELNVTTNARNGFTVTVKEDQNLTSGTGADIDVFQDGNGALTPIAWASPANTLGTENTYGHLGVTSEDSSITSSLFGSADPYGSALFSGAFATTALPVFYHNGPSDGTTAHIGSTTVAFRVQIGSLQEAAKDYSNRIIYVATPVF